MITLLNEINKTQKKKIQNTMLKSITKIRTIKGIQSLIIKY